MCSQESVEALVQPSHVVAAWRGRALNESALCNMLVPPAAALPDAELPRCLSCSFSVSVTLLLLSLGRPPTYWLLGWLTQSQASADPEVLKWSVSWSRAAHAGGESTLRNVHLLSSSPLSGPRRWVERGQQLLPHEIVRASRTLPLLRPLCLAPLSSSLRPGCAALQGAGCVAQG